MQLSPGITRRTRQARRGYTLAELVVVIAVMAAVGGVAIPRLASGNERYKARAASEQLAGIVREAMLEARATSEPKSIEFSSFTDRVKCVDPTDTPFINVVTTEPPYRFDLGAIRLAGKVTVLPIDGFGNPSISGILGVKVDRQQHYVLIDAGAGTVTTGNKEEARQFEQDAGTDGDFAALE